MKRSVFGALVASAAFADVYQDHEDLDLGPVLRQIYKKSETLDLILDEA